MRNVTVARRYAKALYEVAAETTSLDDVLNAMNNVAHAYASTPELRRLLLNPLVKLELKHKLVKSVTSNKTVLRFVDLLAKRKRLDLIPAVNDRLTAMADEAKGLHRALVRTASPLTDVQKRHIEGDLAHRFGGKILGHFEVAKDLIGGVWIQMGDKVLDASIKGRIETFRHTLLHSAN